MKFITKEIKAEKAAVTLYNMDNDSMRTVRINMSGEKTVAKAEKLLKLENGWTVVDCEKVLDNCFKALEQTKFIENANMSANRDLFMEWCKANKVKPGDYITRSISTSVISALFINLKTKEKEKRTFAISGNVDKDKLNKLVPPEMKCVCFSKENVDNFYFMRLSLFEELADTYNDRMEFMMRNKNAEEDKAE